MIALRTSKYNDKIKDDLLNEVRDEVKKDLLEDVKDELNDKNEK